MTETTEICRSQATITLEEPERVLEELLAHMTEHASVIRTAEGARLESPFGTVEILCLSDTILVDVIAASPEVLGMIRWFIAEHVTEFAGAEARIHWSGEGAGERLPSRFRLLRVIRAQDLTPGMRRVTFACDGVSSLAGKQAYHVRLLLPPPGRVPRWPMQRADGRLVWPEGEDSLVSRVYTIREVDEAAGSLSMDFVLHHGSGSPGSDFARAARPGDTVGIIGPGGDGCPVAGNLLLIGDETALPAIRRMIGDLPQQCRVTALVEVADAAEIQALPARDGLDLRWILRAEHRNGEQTALEFAFGKHLASGQFAADLVWGGCEKAVAERIRKTLIGHFPDRKRDFRVQAYWQRVAQPQ